VSKKGSVTGATSQIKGKSYSTYEVGTETIKVTYPISDTQSSYTSCKKGALEAAPADETATAMTPYVLNTACFQDEVLSVTQADGTAGTITPTGAPINKAGRTLKGFSTKAGGLMYEIGPNGGCKGGSDRSTDGCPYFDFKMYYDYYGTFDYADNFVMAAIDGKETSFTNSAGQMDFTGKSDAIRKECTKKGTAYMNAYMYAIREYEDAIDDCLAGCPGGESDTVTGKDCNGLSASAVHAWDEGVAFYTGSLEGVSGDSAGKLAYRLAEKRCKNFKTCGANGDSTSGTSYVNTELFKHLTIGKNNLLQGQCEETRPLLRDMVALMSIPLIQGTLRYAYKVDKLSGGDKEKGEGAVFAAAIVPRVNYCSPTDASTIMTNMKIGAAGTSFSAVKDAFEKNYECLNITCAQVGGLWYSEQDKYYDDAEPCGDIESDGAVPHPGVLSMAKLTILLTMIACFRSR
jgi:hypothetical protein